MDLKKNIGFGCVSLTMHPFERSALGLLETAFELGITHFDTAPLYGQGYSEKILGKFLKHKRDQVTVATKFGLAPQSAKNIPAWLALPLHRIKKKIKNDKTAVAPNPTTSYKEAKIAFREITLAEVQQSVSNSLKSLGRTYIDYYLLHEALPGFVEPPVLEYLVDLKAKGTIRKIGVAAGGINLLDLTDQELQNWDVLQYEYGNHSPELLKTFPGKQHIQHSVLKQLNTIAPGRGAGSREKAGALLALALKKNPGGKLLFSTTNRDHLVHNMEQVKSLLGYPVETLENIITG